MVSCNALGLKTRLAIGVPISIGAIHLPSFATCATGHRLVAARSVDAYFSSASASYEKAKANARAYEPR